MLPANRSTNLNQVQNQRAPADIKITAETVNTFLKLVADGEQDDAEKLLKSNRELALTSGDVTDLAGRSFKNITAFQYAVWALDWHMWTMVRKYLPPEKVKEQLQGMERGSWVQQHGISASWQNLLDALQKYIGLCNGAKWSETTTQWQKQVGGAQCLLPTHVVNEYCRPDSSFKPCPDFTKGSLPRSRKTDEGDWYTAIYNSGKLGESFAYLRSTGRPRAEAMGAALVLRVLWQAGLDARVPQVAADHKACHTLLNTRTQQRDQLFAELSVHAPLAWIGREDAINSDVEQKEDRESAEIKKTAETEQTSTPTILADIQKTLTDVQEQLKQNLQQEQILIAKIVDLENQTKQNNTGDLAQQLAQFKTQHSELLDRQKEQLQQRLTLLETAAEERQKWVIETSVYAEQQFQAEAQALRTHIEDVQRKLEAGDTKQQQQLDQLQQEHNQLMESHKIKQQILAKRQYFESITPLRFFYRSVQVKLQELFLACKVLDSGKVPRTKCTTKDKVAEGIQIAGDWIPLPYASEIASVFSKLLQKQSDKEEKIRAETVAYLAIGFSEIDALSEETARLLTEQYEEQLHCLKPEGAKCLGECAVKYMIAYMNGKLLKPEEPLVPQFLYSVLTLDVHNGWWPKTHKDIATLPPKSGWTDNGIFKHPGIKTLENEFFSDFQKTKVNKYGYRLGTKAEAQKVGFTQTKERVDDTVNQQQPSPLTPAGHNQVVTVTAITQNHGEQLDRIQRQLQQANDRNAELQARLDAQEKEMERVRVFMAQFTAAQSPSHNPQSHSQQSVPKR